MQLSRILACLCLLVGFCYADNWALLTASSKGWNNYRHQADVCHAYQLLKSRGFSEDKIVVLMYDDIANNPKNPFPGKIINEPNGPDVYEGIKIDYKGKDVTPVNFLNVLSGKKDLLKDIGTGRVIESTEDDYLFVYFADHGGSHTLSFPTDLLHASDLADTLRDMSKNNQFKQMLIYVEACEAGSMFDQILGDDLRILVSTASARDEFSYSAFCNEKSMNYTCLGDMYSITWMKALEQLGQKANKKSLFHHYFFVRSNVNSHVQLYGDFYLGFKEIETFFKSSPAPPRNDSMQFLILKEAVPSKDIPLHMAQQLAEHAKTSEKAEMDMKLSELLTARQLGDKIFDDILKGSVEGDEARMKYVQNNKLQLKNFQCYKNLIQEFENQCFKIAENTYVMKHLYVFANLCEMKGIIMDTVIDTVKTVCQRKKKELQVTSMMY